MPDTLYSTTPVDQLSQAVVIDETSIAELIGKTPLQVLDLWMAEADRQGMYVLLNFYSVSKQTTVPDVVSVEPGRFRPGL